ncbi:MAG: hypothetical protein ACI91R_000595, partial [Vicingaceae bacterium]
NADSLKGNKNAGNRYNRKELRYSQNTFFVFDAGMCQRVE